MELYVNPDVNIDGIVDYNQDVAKHLINVVKSSGKFCKSLGQYVYTSIEESDGIMIVSVDNALYGFATLDVDTKSRMLHVDVLCANKDTKGMGVGTEIINQLLLLAAQTGLRGIQLTATNSAAAFYLKNGFTVDKNNNMTRYV